MKKLLILWAFVLATLPVFAQFSPVKEVYVRPSFSMYAESYVAPRIAAWAQKGEFEKTADFENRIKTQRAAMEAQLTDEARQSYIILVTKDNIKDELLLLDYDADREGFPMLSRDYGEYFVPVSVKDAPKFKDKWFYAKVEPNYIIEDDWVVLKSIKIMPDPKKQKKFNTAVPVKK